MIKHGKKINLKCKRGFIVSARVLQQDCLPVNTEKTNEKGWRAKVVRAFEVLASTKEHAHKEQLVEVYG